MKKVLMGLGIVAAIAVGCSKSSSSSSSGTIVGKWTQTSAVSWFEPKTGSFTKDTTFYASASYTNFGSTGSFFTYDAYTNGNPSDSSSGTYTLSGSSLVITSTGIADTFKVQTLTGNSLTLYLKQTNVDTLGSTIENWINFSR